MKNVFLLAAIDFAQNENNNSYNNSEILVFSPVFIETHQKVHEIRIEKFESATFDHISENSFFFLRQSKTKQTN